MNQVELKSDLHTLIDQVNDVEILYAIRAILSAQIDDADLWDELPLSVQESVKRGYEQARIGNTKAHSEMLKKYQEWLLG